MRTLVVPLLAALQGCLAGYPWRATSAAPAIEGALESVSPSSLALAPRSLDDWRLADFVLVSTVDGALQARDRNTGVVLWTLESPPLIQEEHIVGDWNNMDSVWITELTDEGQLLYFTPSGGLERVPATIRDLVEKAPFAIMDNVVYTGAKKTTLYTIDVATGMLTHLYGHDSPVFTKPLCGTEAPVGHNAGTLVVGRTEYTLEIHEKITGHAWKLRFASWGPNTRDRDLQMQYQASAETLYITPIQNTTIMAISEADYRPHRWVGQVPSMMVKVFDVLRPASNMISDTSTPFLLVQQPTLEPRVQSATQFRDVYVGRANSGELYALSGVSFGPLISSSPTASWCIDGFSAPYSRKELAHTLTGVFPSWCQRHSASMGSLLGSSPPKSSISDGLGSTHPLLPGPSRSWRGVFLRLMENLLIVIAIGLALMLGIRQGWLPDLSESLALVTQPKLQDISGLARKSSDHPDQTSELAPINRDVHVGVETDTVTKRAALAFPSSTDLPLSVAAAEEGSPDAHQKPDVVKKRKRGSRGGKKIREAKERAEKDRPEDFTPTMWRSPEPFTEAAPPIIVGESILGYGSHGTMVFKGSFEDREVAVKRMVLNFYDIASHEVQILQESDDHPNVVRYFCKYQTEEFLFIALELCAGTLEDVVQGHKRTPPSFGGNRTNNASLQDLRDQIDPLNALTQISSGLQHLHSLKIVHRDIKPQNILVATPKMLQVKVDGVSKSVPGPARLLISDFGLCKKLEEEQSSFQTTVAAAGTTGWTAPEISMSSRSAVTARESSSEAFDPYGPHPGHRLTRAVDIFSLGCVFYYILSPGAHPFGENLVRQVNIEKNRHDLSGLDHLPYAAEAHDIISRMISFEPKKRPDIAQVLGHPLFWSDQEKLDFLVKISDRLEHDTREEHSELLDKLERRAPQVVGVDWHSRFPKLFIENLGKYRRYHGDRIIDLLRALRNKLHHYNDFDDHMKAFVGPLPEGFLQFFTSRFPSLLMETYHFASREFAREALFSCYFS